MIILIALGSSLLGAWKVVDPTSTSFLAVGLLAVIALLFLIRVIFSPWMIVVIPLVAVVTYTASHWLTSLFEAEAVVNNKATDENPPRTAERGRGSFAEAGRALRPAQRSA